MNPGDIPLRVPNVFDPRLFARGVPHDALRELRDHDPVSWQDEHEVGIWPSGPGFWAVTRHADVRHVLRTPADFSSSLGATQIRDPDPADLPFIRRMVLNMDPPEQVRLRTLVTGAFTRRRLTRFADVIRERAATPAAGRAGSRFDLPRDVTDELPLANLCDLLGVPDRRPRPAAGVDEPGDRLPGPRARRGRHRAGREAGEPALARAARRHVRLRGGAGRAQAPRRPPTTS